MEKAFINITLSSYIGMARYQMQQRNATLKRFFQLAFASLILATFYLFASPASPVVAHPYQLPNQSLSQSSQTQATDPLPYPFVLPTEIGSISLSTHIVDLNVFTNDDSTITTRATAQFRLKNSALTPASTTVRISSPVSGTLPADLSVTLDGIPANLSISENGAVTLDIALAGEASSDVALTYSLLQPTSTLQSIRYPAGILKNWQQRISTSVRLQLPDSVAADSVVQTTPDDWLFPADAGQSYTIRWLFDGLPPEQPFSISFVEPALWQQIVQVRESIESGSLADYLQLGDLYAKLFSATSGELRDSFYAQTLAAYTDGIQRSTDPAISSNLQRRLAQLYRSQIVNANGVINPDYAQLTVNSVDAALAAMPAEDGQRSELLQWRTDALSVLFNEARRRNDWTSARQILDQLSSSAEQSGNSKFVADARRRLVVQQALELLEDGNRDAAIMLAGQEIGAAELRAPDDLTSLFESWQVTVTISPGGTEMEWIGLPTADKTEAANNGLQELLTVWKARTNNQGYQFSLDPLPVVPPQLRQPLLLRITIPAGATGLPLADAIALRTDWALFRLLLAQTAAQVEQKPERFRQRIAIHLPVDLRSVAEQWNAMSANLEQRAAAFEAQASAPLSGTDEEAEAVLRARIQLANYRGAAKIWSSLARNSSIAITLAADSQPAEQARSWLLTPTSPAQTLEFVTDTINWGRVLAAIGALLAALFLASGVLWWLL